MWTQVCLNEGEIDKNTLTKFKKSQVSEPMSKFQPNLAQNILGWRGLQFLQIKGHLIIKKENVINVLLINVMEYS